MPIDLDKLVLGPCMTTWGQPVTFIPGAGGSIDLTAVFDRTHTETNWQSDPPTVERKPMLGCRLASLGREPVENEQFLIGGETWAVKAVFADGLGHLKIHLHGPL